MKEIERVILNNGVEMPALGYGVFQIPEKECRGCVIDAIHAGYRLVDTASAYKNEKAVGQAVKEAVSEGTMNREDLFLTTKVWISDYDHARRSVERSLEYLDTGYIDLVLLHQPFGEWKKAWKDLEDLYQEKKIRAIGVSNFTEDKMKELLSFCRIKPAVNQVERHPFYTQKNYCEELKRNGIQPQSWGSLCEGLMGIFDNPVLNEIGKKYGKTAAQTALRWNLQAGSALVVRSTIPEHMQEDLDVFDFDLDEEDMKKIESLDIGYSEIIDFHNPATERLLLKWKLAI